MGGKIIDGVNNLVTYCQNHDRMDLLQEWDNKRNKKSPDEYSYGSHAEVFWICSKGHSYVKGIHNRVKGTGCPFCSGIIEFKHRDLLFNEYPDFIEELDLSLNNLDDVKNITCGSSKKIHWKCSEGHTYLMSASNKTRAKGCPVCRNIIVVEGINDIGTTHPELLKDWDYKNNIINPNEITAGSQKKISWKCHICSYEWKSVLYSRASYGTGCPNCSKRLNSSLAEQTVYFYVKKIFPDAISGDRTALNGSELDIYIPSIKTGIEYDGYKWHKDIAKDEAKNLLCSDYGIKLYRFREIKCPKISHDSNTVIIECDDKNLKSSIEKLLYYLGKETDIDVSRDSIQIKEQFYSVLKEKNLEKLHPEVAEQWDFDKNGKITPSMVGAESHEVFWWICSEGHSYKASVKNRVRMHSGCPYCAGNKVLKGYNDLETTHPQYALCYNNERNSRKSYEISCGCSDFAWWKCNKCGYEYYYQISTLVKQSIPCPACSGNIKTKFQKVLKWETKEVFDTLPEAAKSLGYSNSDDIKRVYKNISNSCKGKTAMTYGYHWFYVLTDEKGNILSDISSFKIKNTDKSLTNQIFTSKYGQKFTVISDNGARNVDVQFEDGTIVKGKTRQAVREGCIKNPSIACKKKISNHVEMISNNKFINKQEHVDFNSNKSEKSVKNTVEKTSKTKSILGETLMMKCHMNAKVIRDGGWNDIDVEFEDGTIVKNTSRRSFRQCSVFNPNSCNMYLNQTKKMKCGISCTVIEVRDAKDIDVRFEDGTIVRHTTISKFNKSEILTDALSHNYKYRKIGEVRVMKCGKKAKLIADRGAHDIDVEFEDGTIIQHRDRVCFEKGTIAYPTTLMGQVKIMNCGLKATVIRDGGWNDIDVEFEDGTIVKHKRRDHFKNGSITNKK